MAYKKVSYSNTYIGLSTDTKPTGAPIDSICKEITVATGIQKKYVTPDGTNWYETTDDTMSVVLSTGSALIGKVDVNSNLIASTKVIEIQTHFAKNTAAGTEQTAVQIPKPANPVLMYKAAMTNSSIDSALTVKLFNRRTFTITGTAQGADDATHITLAATSNPTDNHYNGFVITIIAGTGIGQSKTILGYVGSTVKAELTAAWDVVPDNTSVYSIALIRDSLAWIGSFAKASLTAPIVKANDSEIITGLFDSSCDVYYVVSNDTLIVNADASRFTAVFQLIPIA